MTCDECKYFKIIQEPLRTEGTIFDFGRVRCEKHNLISDFCSIGHKEFEQLDTCDDFEERRTNMRRDEFPIVDKHVKNEVNAVLDKIRVKIEEPLKINEGMHTESAKAQAIALSWCIEIIDKYRNEVSE